MDVMGAYVPGDTQLVQQLVYELKSQGIFDQFRKECIADVDTKPAYQNLRQRVEGSVSSFLKGQQWSPGMNKNQVREQLRKNIYETGFLDTGVERIVDQVVNPKINTVFLPKVEEVVYKFLGVERPEGKKETADLMPTDLEAVSPGSVHSLKTGAVKKEDVASLDESVNSKVDEDESPPFEPLENNQEAPKANVEDNSVDSYMSGFSGLQSHDSNNASDKKPNWPSGQESQSCNGSDSQFSIVTSDETKMEICEDSSSKSEELKKSEAEVKMEVDGNEHKEKETEAIDEKKKADEDGKSRGSHSSSSRDKKDSKHRKEHDRSRSKSERDGDKSKHNSSSTSKSKHSSSSGSNSSAKEKDKPKEEKDKDKDKRKKKSSKDNDKDKEKKDKDKSTKDKSKEKSKSDKDREKSRKDKDKPKEKSEKNRDKSSSRNEDKEKSSSKSEDKEKLSSSKSEEKEKSHGKNEDKDKSSSKDDKNKSKDSTRHKSSNGKHSSRDKDRSSSSSSSSKKKDDNSHKSKSSKEHKHDQKKSSKDDHYSFKDKNGSRRSFDRDSNDGNSSGKVKQKSDPFPEPSKSVQNSSTTSSSVYGSGDSGNSDKAGEVGEVQKLKLLKPKFASNFEEARKLMKIRKQLTLLERHNQLSLTQMDRVGDEQKEVKAQEAEPEAEAELCTPQISNVSKENWEALEAKLALEMSKTVHCNTYESHYDVPDEGAAPQERDIKEKVPEDVAEEVKISEVKTEEEVDTKTAPEVKDTSDVLEEKLPLKEKTENGKLPHDTPNDSTKNSSIPAASVEAKETIDSEVEAKESIESEVEVKETTEFEVETKTLSEELADNSPPVTMELCVRLESMETSRDQAEDSAERRDDSSDDERCRYLEMPSSDSYKKLNFLMEYVAKLQADLEPNLNNFSPTENNISPPKRGKKRSNENVDMTNNNKETKPEKRLRRKSNSTGNNLCRTSSTEVSLDQNFFLPGLSPAEGDKPSEKGEKMLSSPAPQVKRIKIQSKRHQRYDSEDLYKPRPTIGVRRNRSSLNNT